MTYKIFVPFDGSRCAMRALQHAVGLAQRLGDGMLHVAHAHEVPLLYGEIAVYVPRDKIEQLQRDHSESVLREAGDVLRETGIPHEKEILVGAVAKVLAERAQALHCDLIVMGTRGLTALGDMLMGSVASKVVHLSSLPVTLVK